MTLSCRGDTCSSATPHPAPRGTPRTRVAVRRPLRGRYSALKFGAQLLQNVQPLIYIPVQQVAEIRARYGREIRATREH